MTTAAPQIKTQRWVFRLRGNRSLVLGERPLIMGVLNITPDSFADGGRWLEPEKALDHALAMIEEGADLIDLGAESTRPGGGVYGEGAHEVPEEEELARLLPVLRALRDQTSLPLSVDTRKAKVAREALDAGADLINDVSGLKDPTLARVVAEAGCPIILMHSRGEFRTMQRTIDFTDLLTDILEDLRTAIGAAERAGVDRGQILVDPGIGFGKTYDHNLALLRRLDVLHELGRPVLVGASRKSFIGHVTGAPVDQRVPGSLAAAAWATRMGAHILRVHDVAESLQFLRVWRAIEHADGT